MESKEKKYDKLLQEFTSYKSESDEIMKEYEETITVLNEALKSYKAQNEQFAKEIKNLKSANIQLTKDSENYKYKNLEKMKDLELLNQQFEKINNKYKELFKEKELLNSKVVTLENDNDLYLTKIRQLETTNIELGHKLDSAMENLIENQTEFTNYKSSAEEKIQRLKEEIHDANNEADVIKTELRKKSLDANDNLEVSDEKKNIFKVLNQNIDTLVAKMQQRRKELKNFQKNIRIENSVNQLENSE